MSPLRLKMGRTIEDFHVSGAVPWSKKREKRIARGDAREMCPFFRTQYGIPSGEEETLLGSLDKQSEMEVAVMCT